VNYKDVEKHCMAMRGVTLHQPWGDSRVFKVGGKMFAMISYGDNGKPHGLWFKAGDASFSMLTKLKGIAPCPYLARAKWVAMDGLKPLTAKELKAYLIRAHALVGQKLSKKKRIELGIAELPKEDAFAFDPFA
jgi:predicted DNA-binding protein (MmcQ/YjbR family)